MYSLYEILFLTPFTLFWLLLIFRPATALRLTRNRKYRDATPKKIWFAKLYMTLFVVTFFIAFYRVEAFG